MSKVAVKNGIKWLFTTPPGWTVLLAVANVLFIVGIIFMAIVVIVTLVGSSCENSLISFGFDLVGLIDKDANLCKLFSNQ